MTDIKELAKQAGMHYRILEDEFCKADADGVPIEMIETFAALVRQDEAQACAKHYLKIMREAVSEARAKERNRCVSIIEHYKIPVGNSTAGEIACEMTYSALRDIRDEIKVVEK